MNRTHVRITRFFRNKLSVAILGLLTASTASADDLVEIFNLAMTNDPQVRQARATYNANHTVLSRGRSYLLPTISLSGSTSRDTSGVAEPDPTGRSRLHSFGAGFNSKDYGLNLRQALLNFQAWYVYQSARYSDQAAETRLVQSEQALI